MKKYLIKHQKNNSLQANPLKNDKNSQSLMQIINDNLRFTFLDKNILKKEQIIEKELQSP